MTTATDYANASTEWTCARKKAYSEDVAKAVARRLNAENSSGQGRPGFEGVTVQPYACTRCGRYHIGRVPG